MTATPQDNVLPLRIADARRGIRHVFVRDLVLDAEIGVHAHEKGRTQKIRINVDLAVADGGEALPDKLGAVVCYEEVVNNIRRIVADGHTGLVETLAERIAESGLADKRVVSVRVRIEKLQAIEGTQSVGVEIERFRREAP
jgi:dihydroneopterin aldolase